jgi:hypothetical protein
LESDSECDFTDARIRIPQQIARFLKSDVGDVINKIYARDLLELLAEMISADIDRFRHLAERKFFDAMFLDELSRFPDLGRLGWMA